MNTATQPVPADILDALGYGDMKVTRFNDDDFYLINPLTGEIKADFGSKQKHVAELYVKPGLVIVRGMRAKSMDLWRLPANARRAA